MSILLFFYQVPSAHPCLCHFVYFLRMEFCFLLFCYHHYYYHYYFTPCEFFTPALVGDHSLKFERQQVSSGLQDSSQYSSQSQQCCSVVLILPLNSSSSPLGNISSTPTTIGITMTFIFCYSFLVGFFFLVSWQSSNICLFFCFLLFSLCGLLIQQNPRDGKFCFSFFVN